MNKDQPFNLKRRRPVNAKLDQHKPDSPLQLRFVGTDRHASLNRLRRSSARFSYFLGADPKRWHANVPVWQGVRYKDLYPGITMEVSGDKGRLALRLIAKKGADPGKIRWRIQVERLVLIHSRFGTTRDSELKSAEGKATRAIMRLEFDVPIELANVFDKVQRRNGGLRPLGA